MLSSATLMTLCWEYDCWYACLASLTVGDESAITTESFNAADTHKLINIVVLS